MVTDAARPFFTVLIVALTFSRDTLVVGSGSPLAASSTTSGQYVA